MSTPTPSKRHSLAISTNGPRPLHLLDGNVPSTAPLAPSSWASPSSSHSPYSPNPASTPLSSSSASGDTLKSPRHPTRRQSSISYFPRDGLKSPLGNGNGNGGLRSPATSGGSSLSRSNSLGPRAGSASASGSSSSSVNGRAVPDRKSTGSILEPSQGQGQKERPPLTLTEKHADLLHFIAQKESKCLELRSQLAAHEAELLQLKRKWERIVNRGFERDNASSSSTSSTFSPSSSASPQAAGAAMFGIEGFKEGVQGMSRLIAAAIAEPSRPSSSGTALNSLHASASAAYPSPSPTPTPLPRSLRKHTPKDSSSTSASASSSTSNGASSKSTRFSLSSTSTSSIGEEILDVLLKPDSPSQSQPSSHSRPHTPSQLDSNSDSDSHHPEEQVLIVRDTGATPTMSPNPEFHSRRQVQRAQEDVEFGFDFGEWEGEGEDTITSSTSRLGTKALRRRSGGAAPSVVLGPASPRGSLDLGFGVGGSAGEVKEKEKEKCERDLKRTGSGGSGGGGVGFPPASSIPGFAGAGSPSSWVGSVGKKLGELQRSSTFTKNQKRASLLLSDVSQSFLSALAVSPPSTSTSVSPPPSAFTSFQVSLSSAPIPQASISLLDDNDLEALASAPILVPLTPSPTPKLGPSQKPGHVHTQSKPPSPSGTLLSPRTSLSRPSMKKPPPQPKAVKEEEEDEWNW